MAPHFDVGGELLYHYGSGQEIAMMSLAGRYTSDRWIASATVGQTGWHLSYWHKGNENVKVGVEYEYNTRAHDSSVTAGYQIEVPKSNITFRGMLDTNWTVAAVMEKRLPPLPFAFVLSGMVNHSKNQARFGFGLNIGWGPLPAPKCLFLNYSCGGEISTVNAVFCYGEQLQDCVNFLGSVLFQNRTCTV